MKPLRLVSVIVLLAGYVVPAVQAQHRRDPLTSKEVDELREAAVDPPERLKIWIRIAKARMDNLEDARDNPGRKAERAKLTHDLLEDLGNIADEISDNIENFDRENLDERKPLPDVIAMATDFQAKLRQLKQQVRSDPKFAEEYTTYDATLDNTIDSVNSLGDVARQTLQDQIQKVKEAKEREKQRGKKK
jgi:hypothetical protein